MKSPAANAVPWYQNRIVKQSGTGRSNTPFFARTAVKLIESVRWINTCGIASEIIYALTKAIAGFIVERRSGISIAAAQCFLFIRNTQGLSMNLFSSLCNISTYWYWHSIKDVQQLNLTLIWSDERIYWLTLFDHMLISPKMLYSGPVLIIWSSFTGCWWKCP